MLSSSYSSCLKFLFPSSFIASGLLCVLYSVHAGSVQVMQIRIAVEVIDDFPPLHDTDKVPEVVYYGNKIL